MAWGRKKSGGRKEPLFGLPAALADLRLSPEDRIPAAVDDEKPKKSVPKRKPDEDEDEPPPLRELRHSSSASGRPWARASRHRSEVVSHWDRPRAMPPPSRTRPIPVARRMREG